METVLRHCYTGTLSEEGGKVGQPSASNLLAMATLADRFDVQPCVRHCLETVAGLEPAEFDAATCRTVFVGLPPGLECHVLHSSVIQAATKYLLQVLGDAEAVCGAWYDMSSDLDVQLLRLSLPEVLALLGSDRLKARSENSVLMMADAWAVGPAGRACNDAQLRQITEAVRLGQLSKCFTFDVLPALPWLQLSSAEIMCLVRFAAGGPERQSKPFLCTEVQDSLVNNQQLLGPEAWYSARPRVAWPGQAHLAQSWTMSKSRLTRELQGSLMLPQVMLGQSCCFFNGFCIRLSLDLRATEEGLQACLGHTVYVSPGGEAGRAVDVMAATSDVHLVVMERGSTVYAGPRCAASSMSTSMCSISLVFGKMPTSEVRSAEGWDAYLVGNKLHMQGIVHLAE